MDEWDVTFGEVRRIVCSDETWEAVVDQVVKLSQRYPALFNYPDYWDRVEEHDFSRTFEIVTHWAQEGLNALGANTGWEYLLLDLGDCPDFFRLYQPGGQSLMSEDKLRNLLSANIVIGATELEECLAQKHGNSYAVLFGDNQNCLIKQGITELNDAIVTLNHTTNAADWPDSNAYLLWFAIGSQAFLKPLRNTASCQSILRGRDKLYLLSGFEEIFTYLATVTPSGLIYEYTNQDQFSQSAVAGDESPEGNGVPQESFLF